MGNEKSNTKSLLVVFEKVVDVTVVVEITVTVVCFCSTGNENGKGVCTTCVLFCGCKLVTLVLTLGSSKTLFFLFTLVQNSILLAIVTIVKS